jgi:hypothetical protein
MILRSERWLTVVVVGWRWRWGRVARWSPQNPQIKMAPVHGLRVLARIDLLAGRLRIR